MGTYGLAFECVRMGVLEVLRRAVWAPAVVFSAHVFLSRCLGAYERVPSIDIPMHFAGGVAMALCCAGLLALAEEWGLASRTDELLRLVLVFGVVSTAAVCWEYMEYAADRLFRTTMQLGLEDTLLDMVLGMAGGGVYLAWRTQRRWARARRVPGCPPDPRRRGASR